VVDYVEELGASRLIHVDANGSRIIALDTGGAEIASGTPVHLAFGGSLHVFSAEDGRRVDPHS
jgi:sn-glycerol 3-phosphate transport system ATP-binding protein